MSSNDIRDLAEGVLQARSAPMTLTDLFDALVRLAPELAERWTLPGRGLAHVLKGDHAQRFKRVGVVSIGLAQTASNR